eukprot:CAMPEP_0115569130 /NCGR_PEP_ID=MMETSP0271-20121206/105035_1 /TAXON_ID=71861 /ORGANISM="Scrippsiella trochoidea, Strain CCMP3099" /LENGTH=189 /DNA_ID=CAMNT_0003003647 /DNA_START=393 /DNA_END=963 /DNA_ORIENTATION=+
MYLVSRNASLPMSSARILRLNLAAASRVAIAASVLPSASEPRSATRRAASVVERVARVARGPAMSASARTAGVNRVSMKDEQAAIMFGWLTTRRTPARPFSPDFLQRQYTSRTPSSPHNDNIMFNQKVIVECSVPEAEFSIGTMPYKALPLATSLNAQSNEWTPFNFVNGKLLKNCVAAICASDPSSPV